MTFDEAVDTVLDETRYQGEPLTRDVCEQIVKKLFGVIYVGSTKPGEIAQKYRERYEGEGEWDADVASHFQEAAGAPSK